MDAAQPALPSASRPAWIAASILALTGMIAVNALANALPINGLTTGAISDGYPIFFVPAGYVFSIWGLIYLGLIAFTVTQAFSSAAEPIVGPLRPLFVLSCLANGAWIFAWHYLQLGLSVVLMLVLLGSLIALYLRMRPPGAPAVRPLFRWTLFVPISLYLGWICVATIPNISALLVQRGWDGAPLAGSTWAALMMAVATAILVTLAIRFRDVTPPLVLIWALVGIMVKFPAQDLMRAVGISMVAVLAATVGFLAWRRAA